MDYSAYRLFLTLAERLHFGKTAQQHHMTTSNVTRVIKQLEEELNVRLFERNKREVRLTHKGAQFVSFAQEAVENYETFKHQIQEKDPSQQGGSIRICATVTAAYNILPNIITSFKAGFPKMTTYLETGNTHTALEKLANGDVDVAFGIITPRLKQLFNVQKVLTTPLVYVVPAQSSVKQQKDLQMVLPESGELAETIQSYFESTGFQPRIHSYIEGHEAILAMVSAGVGGAILPKIVVENSHLSEQVKVVKLNASLPSIDVGAFMTKTGLNKQAKETFWTFLKDALKSFKQ